MLALAVISCLASGYVIVALGWPRSLSASSDLLLRLSLSVGFGLGTFSVIFFLSRVLGVGHLIAIDASILTLLVTTFFLRGGQDHARDTSTYSEEGVQLPRWLHRVVTASFVIALCAALYSAVLRAIAHPHGEGWDAFAIWNLHARFLFRGGEHWRDGFSALIPWSHPDYPLLLPSAVAHFWSILRHEDTAVPAGIGLTFTLSTVALLFSSLDKLRGRISALLGSLALLSTPFFIEQGSSQYADVPLAFFFLASMALVHLYDRCSDMSARRPRGLLVLAGLAAGFAAWTKNEGMLFLFASLAAQVLIFVGRWNPRPAPNKASVRTARDNAEDRPILAGFLIAAAPFLLLIAWFKHSIAFSSELFSNQTMLRDKILDPARYSAILKWFAKDFLRFGDWWLIPGTLLLLAFYFAIARKRSPRPKPAIHASVWTLALTLAGYFAIYVITPYDLYWHLRFSLNRLFLQLWPCAIFLFFLALPLRAHKNVSN